MAAKRRKKTPKPRVGLVPPVGHDGWLTGLWKAQETGRLSHALLLTGREGIGKFTAARWLAAGLLCAEGPGRPCLACGPCKRMAADSHPDYMEVDARAHDLDSLTVAFFAPRREARTSGYTGPSVGEFLSLRSAEGGARVVVVREAERMNGSAQNAFLKTLEEPAPGTVLVMESSASGVLLPTILSRVVQVPVPSLDPLDAMAVLKTQGVGEEEEEAQEVREWVQMSQGSPGLAMRFGQQERPAMLGVLLAVVAGELGALEARNRLMELPGRFEGKTPTAQARVRARCFLDLVLDWIQDGERLRSGLERGALALGPHLDPYLDWDRSRRKGVLEGILGIRADVGLNLACESLLDRALMVLAEGRTAASSGRR